MRKHRRGVDWLAPRTMRCSTIACIAIAALALTARGHANEDVSLTDLLARAGTYVRQFEEDFSLVLSDEDYRQKERFDSALTVDATNEIPRPYRFQRQMNMLSEMLFLWVPQDQSWIAVRSPLMVGRQSIPNSKDRIDRVLRDETPGRDTRLRLLAAESARFNLGFYHDYNSPTLALQFLDPAFQSRFTFTIVGSDRVNGIATTKLAFVERQQPTVIVSDGDNLFSTGRLWLRVSDGAVLRTQLTLKLAATRTKAGMNGSVVVEYGRNEKLGMWVPTRMQETYDQIGGINDALDCTATYAHFRRFETSGRILP